MNAELKSIMSIETSLSLEDYCPEDPNNFGLSLTLLIGAKGFDFNENFDMLVCTLSWLSDEHGDEHFWGYAKLIVKEYDLRLIKTTINKFIFGINGNSWQEIAFKLGKVGNWEFENYHSGGK